LTLPDWTALLHKACLLEHDDPIAAWRACSLSQQHLIDRLQSARRMRVRTVHGTDLRFEVTQRNWVNGDGRHNLPDGEVFTAPLEATAEGIVRIPGSVWYASMDMSDLRLRFAEGQVVEASAARGQAELERLLRTDAGATRLGEVALGLNAHVQRLTGHPLIDEKLGGSFHLALGASYPETGGLNHSALHWDLVCDLRAGGSLEVDDQVINRDGRLLIPEATEINRPSRLGPGG
jgi:aminopeptidase